MLFGSAKKTPSDSSNQGIEEQEEQEEQDDLPEKLEKCRKALQNCFKDNQMLKENVKKVGQDLVKQRKWLDMLMPLGEPPYYPAIFNGISRAEDPRKDEIREEFGIDASYSKCWLIFTESEYLGTVNQELGETLKIGQPVLTNSNRAVVAVVPEEEISILSGVTQGEVIEAIGDLILVKNSCGQAIRGTVLSDDLRALIKTEPLAKGDKVLLFAQCIVRVLKRSDQETKKEMRKITFDDIGGLEQQAQEISDVLGLDFDEESWRAMEMGFPRGVVLFGPPGCGKTLTAIALANKLGWYIEIINGPEIENPFIGVSEERMRASFERALAKRPSLWVIDEADALFPIRGKSVSTEHKADYVAQFNVLLDGIEDTRGVFVLLLTNRLDQIDPAVVRPQRFTKKIEIPRPNRDDASEILRIHFHPVAPLETGGADELRKEFIAHIVEELYRKTKSTHLFTGHRGGEEQQKFYFRDFVSGALLGNIAEEIALRALNRMKAAGIKPHTSRFGIAEADIEGIVKKVVLDETPKDIHGLNQWLIVNGYRPIDEYRSGLLEKRRDR